MIFWSIVLGLPLLGYGILSLVAPSLTGRLITSLPRNVWIGRVLCILSWAGTAYELDTIGIEIFDRYLKAFPGELWILAVILAILTCWWMPNLLAIRGVSAIFMLFPAELFPAIRLEPSSWRLVFVAIAYVCIITGMFGMFYPWRIRQALTWRAAKAIRVRLVGIPLTLAGVLALLAPWL